MKFIDEDDHHHFLTLFSIFNKNIKDAIKTLNTKNNFISEIKQLEKFADLLPGYFRFLSHDFIDYLDNTIGRNLHKASISWLRSGLHLYHTQSITSKKRTPELIHFVLNTDESFTKKITVKTKPIGYIKIFDEKTNSTRKVTTYYHMIEFKE